MPPPTPSAPPFTPPTGIKLGDGYQTLMIFKVGTSPAVISFFDMTIKPPGLDGGDPVQTSTMWNTKWHTMQPRVLVKATESTATAAYDPIVYQNILAVLSVEATITIKFPDDSTVCFYGYLAKFEPGELKEGEMPTATITVAVTNTDPTDGSEQPPVFTASGSLTRGRPSGNGHRAPVAAA